MKVMLLGEYSSLHKYLKEGLCEIGIDVKLASSGDGWKHIGGADYQLPELTRAKWNIVNRIGFYMDYVAAIKQIKGYDVVQLIGPGIFPKIIWKDCLESIIKNNGMISLISAGENYTLYQAWENGLFEYYIYDQIKNNEIEYGKKSWKNHENIRMEKAVEDAANIIIPSLYEYEACYNSNKISKVIPFPINYSNIKYRDNIVTDKVVFFHGLNRENVKGTRYIKTALEKLKNDYPDEVEIIIDGHMPFDEYMKILEKTNVVVDQCCSYGYGINACVAMALGKVVMSGCRIETLNSFKIDSSPIVCSKPSVDYLYDKMVEIVKNKDSLLQKGLESRQYVETLHDYKKNAQLYVDAWKSTGRI